jgi:hypothetical protein
LTELIGFKCALDDIGNRPLFSARKPVSKIARFGAANRKLWFSHGVGLVECRGYIRFFIAAIKMACDGLVAALTAAAAELQKYNPVAG